ncbi:FIMAH domain-containing protein [Paenibacillus senegalensis]|uniref:FIMAH domain-containing protein n=1 Tax=Paenibacillus senegalensis TaxID=1465766 RepID=UPI000287C9BC|nr:hypothetical protein [Paenibacillus senegalensis]
MTTVLFTFKWKRIQTVGCISLVAVLLLSLFPARPAHAYVDRSFSAPIDLGSPIQSIAIYDSAYGVENGRDVMYTTTSGNPAQFQVIDVLSQEVLRVFPLPGSESSWTHLTVPDGTVYIGGNGKLYQYSPQTQSLTDLGGIGESVVYGLSHDEQGRVYFGSYPNAKIGRYDPATGEMKDYGTVAPGQSYTRSTAYHDGYIYAGIGTSASVVKIDAETGEKETIALPDYPGVALTGTVNQLDVAGRYLVAGVNSGTSPLLFYDLELQQWSSTYYENNRGIRLSYGVEGSNVVYFIRNGQLMELNINTLQLEETGLAYGSYLRNSTWVNVPNDPDLPGLSLITVTFGGGIVFFNPQSQIVKSVQYPIQGNPIPIQALETGPDGKLYMSGYPGGQAAVYSPDTDKFQMFPLGQAEGMTSFGSKLFLGVYPGAAIHELDTNKPLQASVNPVQRFTIPHQDRPFSMTSDEKRLFIGTIPDYGELGGALTIYEPETGSAPVVHENLIENQSIVGLTVADGKLYGSTTVAGGLGIDPVETAAKLFVWDIASGTKLQEWVPAIPGISSTPRMISGLTAGPDGQIWAAADGTLFAFDPDTLEITKSETIYPEVSNYGRWRPVYIRTGADGLLYTTLAGRITVVDPDSLESVTLATTPLMTLGHDGHIYYADDTQLMKIEVGEGTGEFPVTIQLPLANSSFEEPWEPEQAVNGWPSLFTITPNAAYSISNERAADGQYSLKLTDASTTETVALASEPLPVQPGEEYKTRLQVYLESGRTLASMNFYDEAGTQVGGQSVQITSGHGQWIPLELAAHAPENAATVRVVLFCSQLWMTTAFYDDVSISYTLMVSPQKLLTAIEDLTASGDLRHPLSQQLSNAVRKAIHHYDHGRERQALHQLANAKKHLDRARDNSITSDARSTIAAYLEAIMARWAD